MLRGLELLTDDEMVEVGNLIGVDLRPDKSRDISLLTWMAGVVGSNRTDPRAVERAVLEWVAHRWAIDFQPSIDTNDLERLVRRKIATEATEFLAPAWRIACALMAEEASVVSGQKFEMLTKAAGQVVPSESVLKKHHEEWSQLSDTWSREDPRAALEGDLKILEQHPALGRQALMLGLIIALADGRLSEGEERLVEHFAPSMGMSEEEARELTAQLNQRFYEHRARLTQLGPLGSGLEAAELTLAGSGALRGLAREARENVVHEDEAAPREFEPQGWSKLLGALSGIVHFFSSRDDEEAPANLVRIVYLTIERQRAEFVGRESS